MKHAIRTTFERRYHLELPWYIVTEKELGNEERLNAIRIGAQPTHPYNGRRKQHKMKKLLDKSVSSD
jgi:hypothetical protein